MLRSADFVRRLIGYLRLSAEWPFYGKWHLLALSACLASWALAERSIVPFAFLTAYVFFLALYRHVALLFGLSATVAAVWLVASVQPDGSALPEGRRNLTGKIVDAPVFDGDRLLFTMKVDPSESVKVNVHLPSERVKDELSRFLKPGQMCVVSGQLKKPRKPTNFHAFDYRTYLARHHIYRQIDVRGSPDCSDRAAHPIDWIKRFRYEQMMHVSSQFTADASAMINALVFGDGRGIEPELEAGYRLYGIVHLLVVSGMHVAVVFGALYLLLCRIGMVREHVEALFLLLIPIYVLLTGAGPSIVRAGLTAWLYLAGRLIGKGRLPASDLLSFSCVLMVLSDPLVVFDLGFQLSFAVTFALLAAGSKVGQRYRSAPVRLIVLSLVSELAAFPIIVGHFYQFAPVGFLFNLFFAPFITAIILPLSTLAYVAAAIFPMSASLFSSLIERLIFPPHRLLVYLYHHPFFQLNYGALTPWMMTVSLMLIVTALLLFERLNRKRAALLLALPLPAIYGLISLAELTNPHGSVTFLDVGQGDSIVIQLPHRQGNVLIDTGGTIRFQQDEWRKRRKPFEVGRDVVLNELRAMGIDALDAVILTHRDADHTNGFRGLVGQIPIRKLMTSPYFDPDESDLRLFKAAVRAGTEPVVLSAGDAFKIGDAVFSVLAPYERMEGNDNSLVVHAWIADKAWLFTGDLEAPGESRMLNRYPAVRADVLKLGHHGSRSSTSDRLLNRLKPAIAVISAGRGNRYGHPHGEVLDRLRRRRVHTLRTDQSGALRFSFTREKVTGIETALEGR